MKRRLDVLDGLRGCAIVLVFLNHIDSRFIAETVPSFLKPVVSFLFTSGNLGVTFFFVLSGFLMAYLYAAPHPREFIEKRYARIFPPFLTMVICMSIFHFSPSLSLFPRVAIMFFAAWTMRLLWIHCVEKFHLGSILIRLFLILQLLAALWYGFFIMRQPPAWFASLPFIIQKGTITFVNATLTLPLGNYIPLLDGVYWSLIPEVIFYLLYPYIFAPTVRKLHSRTPIFIGLFIVLLFPFLFGTSLLFEHVWNLKMLFIEYFIYFCSGIVVANLAKRKTTIRLPPFINRVFNPICFILLLFLSYLFLTYSQGNVVARLFLSIPFGFIVYGLLDETTSLYSFFNGRSFLMLGTVSYSLYIGHTALVDGMHLLFKPHDIWTNILFLLITAVLVGAVSYVMHMIIETPYFMFKPKNQNHPFIQNGGKKALLILIIFFLVTIFSAYSSKYNFFSTVRTYENAKVSINTARKDEIEITDNPLLLSFTAEDNNLGVILLHLTNHVGSTRNKKTPVDPLKNQKLLVRVKEDGAASWYASQETSPAEIGNSTSYPIGIPLVKDSLSKKYVVELSMIDIDYKSVLHLHTKPYVLQTVQQLDKKQLLLHPLLLMRHGIEKTTALFNDKEALLVVVCVTPLFVLLTLL